MAFLVAILDCLPSTEILESQPATQMAMKNDHI